MEIAKETQNQLGVNVNAILKIKAQNTDEIFRNKHVSTHLSLGNLKLVF